MTNIEQLQERYGALVLTLSVALESGDDQAFGDALDRMVRLREKGVFVELRRLTDHLHSALERFRVDSRLVDIAEREVPDARFRLDHVLTLTDEAAHRTMDLVEQSCPIAERTAKSAAELLVLWKQFRQQDVSTADFRGLLDRMVVFLEEAQVDTATLRNNLAEVLLAQGYQDLSGQIIRSVMKLVAELEVTLGALVSLAADGATRAEASHAERPRQSGPVVPGIDHGVVVSGQTDVDSLLSGLGI